MGMTLKGEGKRACDDGETQVDKKAVEQEDPEWLISGDAGRGQDDLRVWGLETFGKF